MVNNKKGIVVFIVLMTILFEGCAVNQSNKNETKIESQDTESRETDSYTEVESDFVDSYSSYTTINDKIQSLFDLIEYVSDRNMSSLVASAYASKYVNESDKDKLAEEVVDIFTRVSVQCSDFKKEIESIIQKYNTQKITTNECKKSLDEIHSSLLSEFETWLK